MCTDLLSATGKAVVKDRKQDLNAFFTVYLRSRKFEISCCDFTSLLEERFTSGIVFVCSLLEFLLDF